MAVHRVAERMVSPPRTDLAGRLNQKRLARYWQKYLHAEPSLRARHPMEYDRRRDRSSRNRGADRAVCLRIAGRGADGSREASGRREARGDDAGAVEVSR